MPGGQLRRAFPIGHMTQIRPWRAGATGQQDCQQAACKPGRTRHPLIVRNLGSQTSGFLLGSLFFSLKAFWPAPRVSGIWRSMMTRKISRREALLHTGLLAGAALALRGAHGAEPANAPAAASSFRFCLNTATLRGHKLGIVKEL